MHLLFSQDWGRICTKPIICYRLVLWWGAFEDSWLQWGRGGVFGHVIE